MPHRNRRVLKQLYTMRGTHKATPELLLLLLLLDASVVSDSVRPHRQQPTSLCHPWDSPAKNIGVGCHFLLHCVKVKVKSLGRDRLVATPWTAAHQAPPSMGFSRQEFWSGLPLSSPHARTTNCQSKTSPNKAKKGRKTSLKTV